MGVEETAIEMHKRMDREYIKISHIILGDLEMFASEAPQKEKWYHNFFETYLLYDWVLSFDSDCELLKPEMRKGILPELNCKQLKELLRANRIFWQVANEACEDAERGLKMPQDCKEINRRLVEHPLWKKMAQQSRKTLELLRR